MTTRLLSPRSLATGLALALAMTSLCLAGDLEPPAGPVGPTMKPLDQIEPRTPLTDVPGDNTARHVITAPGSYYLTASIIGQPGRHGVIIDSDNVTLDLNGFSIIGVSGSLDGVHMLDFYTNIAIRNGMVRGWGRDGMRLRIDSGRIERITSTNNSAWGIMNLSGSFSVHILVCEANDNGVLDGGGINAGSSSVVGDCVVRNNRGPGIQTGTGSVVSNSVAFLNNIGFALGDASNASNCTAAGNTAMGFNMGISASLTNCTASANGQAGFLVSAGSTLIGCSAMLNTGHGFFSAPGASFINCTARANSSDGFRVQDDCDIRDCHSSANSGNGFHLFGNRNYLEGSTARTNAGPGIRITGAMNHVVRNTSINNMGGSFELGANKNRVGAIVDTPVDADAWANFAD